MKKLPFYLRLGFFIMGVDPYAPPKIPLEDQAQDTPPQVNRQPPITGPGNNPTTQAATWIPTDKQLPEYYKSVTIFTTDKEILYNWARVNDDKEDYYIHPKDNKIYYSNEITHWMYIETP